MHRSIFTAANTVLLVGSTAHFQNSTIILLRHKIADFSSESILVVESLAQIERILLKLVQILFISKYVFCTEELNAENLFSINFLLISSILPITIYINGSRTFK